MQKQELRRASESGIISPRFTTHRTSLSACKMSSIPANSQRDGGVVVPCAPSSEPTSLVSESRPSLAAKSSAIEPTRRWCHRAAQISTWPMMPYNAVTGACTDAWLGRRVEQSTTRTACGPRKSVLYLTITTEPTHDSLMRSVRCTNHPDRNDPDGFKE